MKLCTNLQHKLTPRQRAPVQCGIYVPSESFGGMSPEKKAAQAMKKLFTFCAARCIQPHFRNMQEGSGRGSLASYNAEGYDALTETISDLSKMDTSDWLKKLSVKNNLIAVRVMEVRLEYCKDDFEWDNCKKVADHLLQEENLNIMRETMESTSSFE